ncbi:MAG: LysR family transcriptional regulator [Butyrivibrio sp.]|nr:LysR family transcriptional regulator [Butyrivibrio sp.]MEE3471159.1 LysR family transcriptional regulator [Butyrivibrio hungatei]
MTILQLKYVIAIDEECSMRKAADKLHVSQPGLSIAIRELENEIGIRIFQRVHHGVVTTVAGRTFIANARSTVEVYEKFEEKFLNSAKVKPTFSVSMQHYTFAVNAFVDLIKENGYDDVQYSVKETQTNEVIENVKTLISEVGVIALSDYNRAKFNKIFAASSLEFHELFECNSYVYLWKNHPLADRGELSLEELQDYPCMVFDQGENSSFYFREEALATYDYKRVISTNERATSMELMIGLDGYAVGSGLLDASLNTSDFNVIKLKEEEILTLGYIVRAGVELSELAQLYIKKLEEYRM